VQAGRVANPTFTFERLVRGESVDIGRLLSFGLGDLLTWPLRANVSKAALEEARLRTVADVVRTASETRQAWVQAAAAQQAVAYFEDVRRAAEASAELARRMQAVGNYSKLQRAREQAFYADSVTQQARALQANIAARERLIRLLGLDRTQAARLQLPQRLPDLPAEPQPESAVTQQALDDRLDLQLARASLEAAARAQGFTRTASWVDGLHLGLARNSETGAPPQRGFELDVPLPLADAGDARRAAANAAVLARLHRADQIAVDARSQVAEAYHAYRTAYDIARHYRDEIVPLRRTIADENLLRYNGMLIGVFELLADAREQIASVIAAIETQRDFWLADAALRAAQIGTPVAGVTMQPTASAGSAGAGGH
jgi:outer membrane protein TolC